MATLNSDADLLVEFIDANGAPYTPAPAPTLDLFRINADDFAVDTLETDVAVVNTGAGGIFGFLVGAADNDELGTFMAVWTTTDTNLPVEFRSITTYEEITPAVDVDPTTIAAAVWDRLTSAAGVVGSFGKTLADFMNTLLQRTSGGSVTISDPFNALTGDLTIVRGDSYEADTPRPIVFTVPDAANYTFASVTFKARTRYSDTLFTKAADMLSTTEFRPQFTSAETAAFAVGRDAYRFDLSGLTTGGDTVTLALGRINVVEDVK